MNFKFAVDVEQGSCATCSAPKRRDSLARLGSIYDFVQFSSAQNKQAKFGTRRNYDLRQRVKEDLRSTSQVAAYHLVMSRYRPMGN